MFINEYGQYFGMVSGGCIDEDLLLHARKCLDANQCVYRIYDLSDEYEGQGPELGCGGKIEVVLQPIRKDNQYLGLEELSTRLNSRLAAHYSLNIRSTTPDNHCVTPNTNAELSSDYVTFRLEPPKHLLIIGGGVDAIPVAQLAKQMGWEVSVYDPRTRNARPSDFKGVDRLIRSPIATLPTLEVLTCIEGAVVMSHSVSIDAAGLTALNNSSAKYVALLGPSHRAEKVMSRAALTLSDLRYQLASPAGLNLGGDLPESIALSIISEAHAYFARQTAHSLSGALHT